MAIERLLSNQLNDNSDHRQQSDVNSDQDQQENSLRPKDFANYVGQDRLKKHLNLTISAAKKRGEPIDHVLLHGPPGLGKTTMAMVIANEMGAQIKITSGPAIERPGDLASLLTNLQDGDILFIDEIHRLNRTVEEVLYSAMEDFKLDIMQIGFIERTPRGRKVTPKAYKHLGKKIPVTDADSDSSQASLKL